MSYDWALEEEKLNNAVENKIFTTAFAEVEGLCRYSEINLGNNQLTEITLPAMPEEGNNIYLSENKLKK